MDIKSTTERAHGSPGRAGLSYLVELRTAGGPLAYIVARADTQDDARALIDAHLERDEGNDDVVIVGVYTIH